MIDLANIAVGTGGILIFGQDASDFSGFPLGSAWEINCDGSDNLIVGVHRGNAAGNFKVDVGDRYLVLDEAGGSSAGIDPPSIAAFNATLAEVSVMVSIVYNDTVLATPSPAVRHALVGEKAETAIGVAMLRGPKEQASNGDVIVDYSTHDVTAMAGSHHAAVAGTLTMASGETVKTVAVADMAHYASVERFGLNLSNAGGAAILDEHSDSVVGASDASAVALPRISVSDMMVSEDDGYGTAPH